MHFRSALLTTVLGAVLVLAAGQASATAITGSSQGSFDDLDDCRTSGGSQDCRIVNTTANGNSTQVQWGSTSNNKNFTKPRTLTAVDLAISTTTDADDVTIARLDWFNSSTRSNKTPDDMSFDWLLSLAFSSPNVSNLSETFSLTMIDTDNFRLSSLDHLSFDLDGVTVSNLKYSVVDGAGSCSGTDSSFASNVWYNCAGNTATLFITADFTATLSEVAEAAEAAEAAVSEPATLALFAAGLLSLAILRHRRHAAGRRRFKRGRGRTFEVADSLTRSHSRMDASWTNAR